MIDSTSSAAGTSAANAIPTDRHPAPAYRAGVPGDQLSTDKANQLRSALANQSEVRADMVERGRALAADPNYPPMAVIQQVAGQILNSPDLSEDQS